LCVLSTGPAKKGAALFRAWTESFSLALFYALRNVLKFQLMLLPVTAKAQVTNSILCISSHLV